MKTKMLQILLFLVFYNVGAAHALEILTEQYEIVAVLPGPADMNIQLSPNPPQCTGNWWGTQAVLKKEAANYSGISANLMAAFMANKKLQRSIMLRQVMVLVVTVTNYKLSRLKY